MCPLLLYICTPFNFVKCSYIYFILIYPSRTIFTLQYWIYIGSTLLLLTIITRRTLDNHETDKLVVCRFFWFYFCSFFCFCSSFGFVLPPPPPPPPPCFHVECPPCSQVIEGNSFQSFLFLLIYCPYYQLFFPMTFSKEGIGGGGGPDP